MIVKTGRKLLADHLSNQTFNLYLIGDPNNADNSFVEADDTLDKFTIEDGISLNVTHPLEINTTPTSNIVQMTYDTDKLLFTFHIDVVNSTKALNVKNILITTDINGVETLFARELVPTFVLKTNNTLYSKLEIQL